jgi:hypothetical protein
MSAGPVWTRPLRLSEVGRGAFSLTLEADAATCAEIAKTLGLRSLSDLKARLNIRPWLDGAEITGRVDARAEQICGVTLDPFEQPVSADIDIRVVPAGSPNAPTEDGEGGEIVLDSEAPDPPDVLEGEEIDLAGYVVEYLALEIDPFPRKPGAAFDYQPPEGDDSPFGVLKQLKDRGS